MDQEFVDFTISDPLSSVTLEVEDQLLYVHKEVLAVWSPVFRSMFLGNFKESKESSIPLPGKKVDEFVELLHCMYPPIKAINGGMLLNLTLKVQMQNWTTWCYLQIVTKPYALVMLNQLNWSTHSNYHYYNVNILNSYNSNNKIIYLCNYNYLYNYVITIIVSTIRFKCLPVASSCWGISDWWGQEEMWRISLDKGWKYGVVSDGSTIWPSPIAREVYRQGEENYYFQEFIIVTYNCIYYLYHLSHYSFSRNIIFSHYFYIYQEYIIITWDYIYYL